jgi:hypothetical protein
MSDTRHNRTGTFKPPILWGDKMDEKARLDYFRSEIAAEFERVRESIKLLDTHHSKRLAELDERIGKLTRDVKNVELSR